MIRGMAPSLSIRSIVLITSMAVTLVNFRGLLIKALVSRGIRVYALAPDYDDGVRDALRALGAEPVDISLERTGTNLFRDLNDCLRLRRQLLSLRPDAVLAYFIKPVIYGSLASWAAGVPKRYALVAGLGYVFTDGGGPVTLRRRLLRRVVRALYRTAFAVCDCVFFQNHDDIEYLVGRRRRPRPQICRLNGSGVDLDALQPVEPVTDPVTFLLMARLLREKGIAEYVEAARAIKATRPDVRFILLGDVDPNPGGLLRADVESWANEGIVEWPGHVHDVRPWIAKASVYVLPSYREGMPRSTQEAMAMARPVITTDAVGCRETAIHGESGFIVPVRDVDALREAMLRFVNAPNTIVPMGKASRRLAEERFDARCINAMMLNEMGID
jgi:glycosyltransferase involved in cell wall biosynthesis